MSSDYIREFSAGALQSFRSSRYKLQAAWAFKSMDHDPLQHLKRAFHGTCKTSRYIHYRKIHVSV